MQVDVIVVGSGGAGMSAALTAAVGGAEVLVLERTDRLGGTTTYSGGALWIPNNRLHGRSRASRIRATTRSPTCARLTNGFVAESMLADLRRLGEPDDRVLRDQRRVRDELPLRPGRLPAHLRRREGRRSLHRERSHRLRARAWASSATRCATRMPPSQSPFHANLHTSAELTHMQRTGIDIDPDDRPGSGPRRAR